MRYLDGSIALVRFYMRHLSTLYNLPGALKNPDVLARRLAAGGAFELKVPAEPAKEYNRSMQALAASVRTAPTSPLSFRNNLFMFFALRIVCCVCAIAGFSWQLCLAVASLQFLLLPYSAFVSFTQFVALFPPLFSGHICIHVPLQLIFDHFFPFLPSLTISPTFIAAFFILDFMQCAACAFVLPASSSAPPQAACKSFLSSRLQASQPMPFSRLFKSVFFGFLNTKTYFLLLLAYAPSCRINLAVWLLDACLQLSPQFAAKFSEKTMHWAALFYHQHRLAHLPEVYQQAHKFHHHLPDACAFDAHIYGSGAPEEFFLLLTETVVAACCGCCPPSLSCYVYYISWTNKVGHTRKQVDAGGCNAHVDHHKHSNSNFGIYNVAMDMYFGTCTHNSRYEVGTHEASLQRAAGGDDYDVFVFKPRQSVAACVAASQ